MAKRLVILGGGESGVGAAQLGKAKGYEVFLSDSGKLKTNYRDSLNKLQIKFEEGGHTEQLIYQADLVVKSPGIPDKAPLLNYYKQNNIQVISEIEFAMQFTKATIIGVTGSNGKTTTTNLIYHLTKKAGLKSVMAGNVGKSFAAIVATQNFDVAVLELSSFQLDGMYNAHINIAILLNITEDHLDRYQYNFQNYVNSKFKITQNLQTTDFFIYCADDEVITNQITKHKIKAKMLPFSIKEQVSNGADISNNNINIKYNKTICSMSIQNLALQGKHNIYNSMASGIAGRILDIRKETIRDSLSDFQNLEHRLEPVINVCGVEYINDSKATNINSTWYALETMEKPTVWIVGGVDKGNDYTMLKEIVNEKVKAIICLGKDNSKIIDAFNGLVSEMVEAKSMAEAVAFAYQIANKGDIVLLSPACASFDLFDNYEDRGRQFKEAVKAL